MRSPSLCSLTIPCTRNRTSTHRTTTTTLVVLLLLAALALAAPTAVHTANSPSDDVLPQARPDATHVRASSDAAQDEQEESAISGAILVILVVLVICILVAYKIQAAKFKYLHETGASILIGALFGLIIRFTSERVLKQVARLDQETFFLLLLPPIIFESGYNMKRRNFFRNFGSILVFAVFGTIVSTLIIGSCIYAFGQWGWSFALTPVESASFGALISAVDPVTMLAIFHSMDADVTLYALVFGESVLNDAVAIVLFRTLAAFPADMEFGADAVGTAIGQFLGIFLGSFATGVAVGMLSALFFKHVHIERFHVMETGLMFLFAYTPYLVAEAAGMSGIVALLFAGITMSHYTYYNIQHETQIFTKHAFQVLAYLAETMVFAYIGLAVFSFSHSYHPGLIILTILICLISRVFNVFPLAALVNHFRKKVKISWQNQIIMWWAGLRGAIAFILALSYDTANKNAIVTTTLSVVIFTVFGLGGTTSMLLGRLKIKTAEESMNAYADLDASEAANARAEVGVDSPGRRVLRPAAYTGFAAYFKGFDKRVLKPFLIAQEDVHLPPVSGHARTQGDDLYDMNDDDEDDDPMGTDDIIDRDDGNDWAEEEAVGRRRSKQLPRNRGGNGDKSGPSTYAEAAAAGVGQDDDDDGDLGGSEGFEMQVLHVDSVAVEEKNE